MKELSRKNLECVEIVWQLENDGIFSRPEYPELFTVISLDSTISEDEKSVICKVLLVKKSYSL